MNIQGIENSVEKVDRANCIIYGVSLISVGPAKGHDMDIDDVTLNQIMTLFPSRGLKAKINHRDNSGVRSINGRFKTPRTDRKRFLADWYLNSSHPDTPWILEAAEDQPEDFGISIRCIAKQVFGPDKRKKMRVSELKSADLVDDPAANDSLLESAEEDEESEVELDVEPGASLLLELAENMGSSLQEAEAYRREALIIAGRSSTATDNQKMAAMIELRRKENPDYEPFGMERVCYELGAGMPYSFSRQTFDLSSEELILRSNAVLRGQAKGATHEETVAAQYELNRRRNPNYEPTDTELEAFENLTGLSIA